jgi:hypothetical protein
VCASQERSLTGDQKYHQTLAVTQHTAQQISGKGLEIRNANQRVIVEVKWTKRGKAENINISRTAMGNQNGFGTYILPPNWRKAREKSIFLMRTGEKTEEPFLFRKHLRESLDTTS